MKTLLKLLFGSICLFMIVLSIHTQHVRSILLSPVEFNRVTSPWAVATLFDAYFGFTTFWVWVCFKERSVWAKALWFVLIMALGNIAMSGYILIQLFSLSEGEPASAILTRRSA